jgi:ABC-2 type transport system permease protein
MRAMIIKEFRELRRDHRTLGMVVFMPILLLIVFGYAANFHVDSISVAVFGPQAEQVEAQLATMSSAAAGDEDSVANVFDIVQTDPSGDSQTAYQVLQDNDADVAIVTGQTPMPVYIDGSSLFAAQTAVAAFNRLGDRVDVQILFNPDLNTAFVMIPAIIGLILTFVGTVVTSIGLVKERERGTLEQLAVMPIKPSTVILGKIAPYFILGAADMVAVTLLGMLLFGVPFNGNPFVFALGAGIFLFVVLGLGVFISTISANVAQAIQTAFFFLLPQILLSGIIFPLDAMPWGVRWISYFLPLTYFNQIAQGVMVRGAPIDSMWLPFLALTVLAVVVFSAAVLRFRRSLSPAGRHHEEAAA